MVPVPYISKNITQISCVFICGTHSIYLDYIMNNTICQQTSDSSPCLTNIGKLFVHFSHMSKSFSIVFLPECCHLQIHRICGLSLPHFYRNNLLMRHRTAFLDKINHRVCTDFRKHFYVLADTGCFRIASLVISVPS